MRAVITGCAGFIGSHLAQRLVAEGWQVTGVDAFTPYYDVGAKRLNLAGLVAEPAFDLVEGDLTDLPLAGLFADRPVVVHLAGQPGVRGSFGGGFEHYVHDNVLATQRVFEAALRTGCDRVVYASSSSVYGDAAAYPSHEVRTPRRPRSPYGVTKATCEDLAEVYRTLGLQAVGLRYFTVYGPRQRPDMAIRRMCEAMCGGPRFRLHGDGSQSRDFTFVDDAVEATVRTMMTAVGAPTINVGGGQEATVCDIISMLEDVAGRRLPMERGPILDGDVRRTGADTGLARQLLGWSPSTALPDGLAAEFSWVRAEAEMALTAGGR